MRNANALAQLRFGAGDASTGQMARLTQQARTGAAKTKLRTRSAPFTEQKTAAISASANGRRKSVFIVDDHPVFSDGLSRLLRSELKIDVVGVAFNAVEALQRILKTPCDLALVDVALPGRSGIELARDIHAMRPKTSVLVLSAYDEVLYAERALRSHARGYIMKHEQPMRIVEAVKTVLSGNVWFSQQISAKLFDAMMGRSGTPRTSHPIDRLTDRELEILKLIGEGRRNKDIANRLNLSPKTIDVHRSHIREKLGLQSGPELVCYAAKWADASVGANLAALVSPEQQKSRAPG